MRRYPITTNTSFVLALPALTVGVHTYFWNPPEVLPPRPSDEGKGRDTWLNGEAAEAYFQLSARVEPGQPVKLADVVDLEGKKVHATRRSRRTGVVVTEERNEYGTPSREVAEARVPVQHVTKGSYLLAIVPPPERLTKPLAPSGPRTTIEAGTKQTYRPLYVLLTFDDDIRLVDAKTVLYENERILENPPVVEPGTTKVIGRAINHGYVTAFSYDEIAIDWKPDFTRTVRTLDAQKAATESGNFRKHVDIVVVHGTGGPIIGPAYNTATGPLAAEGRPYGPHYELDVDGHCVKFAYDDAYVAHAGDSRFFDIRTKRDLRDIASRSVGIEVVNRAQENTVAQAPFQEQQMLALIRLLTELRAAHPDVERHRIVGHLDISTNKAGTTLSNRRITCPGRNMQWPRLEQHGLGRVTVQRALGAADYSGFFSLTPADFPAKFPGKPKGTVMALRPGDNDATERWGGVNWKTKEAKDLLAARGLTFKNIIREVQTDVQTLGYLLTVSGKLEGNSEAALRHCIHHIFSGSRKGEIPGGSGLHPEVIVNPTVAAYLKGSVDALPRAAAPAGGGGGAGAGGAGAGGAGGGGAGGAGGAGGPHAELSPEMEGDMHDHRYEEGEAGSGGSDEWA